MASARNVARAFFPLDDELGLLSGRLSPTLHGWLVRLASYLPFAQAAALLSEFAHVSLSQGSAQRLTYAAGTSVVVEQTLEAERIVQEMPEARPGPACLLLSADGAMVPLVGGDWAEVKTLVVGKVEAQPHADGSLLVQTTELSSFSRLAEAETFTHLATVETSARGVELADKIVAVSDGAEWLQKMFDLHCPQAERILDFPHAAQRLSHIASVVFGEGTLEARSWYETQRTALKQSGAEAVLAVVEELCATYPELEGLAEDAAYLSKRRALMNYPSYQAQGLPIASGCVESANKLVVEARLKGAGMHWARAHVNPMVALRNVVCSDRWAEVWPRVQRTERAAARQARRSRRAKHTSDVVVEAAPAPVRTPLPGGKAHPPPATHPWKRPTLPGGARHNLTQRAAPE
jgi:hypothetical protein